MENREKEQPGFLVDRDILGQEKSMSGASPSQSQPKRILIVIAVLAVLAIGYWLASGR